MAEVLSAALFGFAIFSVTREGSSISLAEPIGALVKFERQGLSTLFGALGLRKELPGWLLETGWLGVATIFLIFEGFAKAIGLGTRASAASRIVGVAAGLGATTAYFDLSMADVILDGPASFLWSASSFFVTAVMGFALRHQIPGRVFWHVGTRGVAMHAAGAMWFGINWALGYWGAS